jgi:uncharacterized membrane protein YphA (DoxX/SURF4 family)
MILTDAKFSDGKLHDIAFLGLRLVIGAIFIVQGSGKFNKVQGNLILALRAFYQIWACHLSYKYQ